MEQPKSITKNITGNKLLIKPTYGWNPGLTFTITGKRYKMNSIRSMPAATFTYKFNTAKMTPIFIFSVF